MFNYHHFFQYHDLHVIKLHENFNNRLQIAKKSAIIALFKLVKLYKIENWINIAAKNGCCIYDKVCKACLLVVISLFIILYSLINSIFFHIPSSKFWKISAEIAQSNEKFVETARYIKFYQKCVYCL